MTPKLISQQKNKGKKSIRNRDRDRYRYRDRNRRRICKFGFFDECENNAETEQQVFIFNIEKLASPKVCLETLNGGDIRQTHICIGGLSLEAQSSFTNFPTMYSQSSRVTCFKCHVILQPGEIDANCDCRMEGWEMIEFLNETLPEPRVTQWCCFGCGSGFYCKNHINLRRKPQLSQRCLQSACIWEETSESDESDESDYSDYSDYS